MKLDAKVKGGLAWAGLVVILAVPSADLIFGKSGDTTAAAITPAAQATPTAKPETATAVAEVKPVAKPKLSLPAPKTDPIQTASVDGKDPVADYVKSGKKLPSYISDGDEAAAPPPAAVKPPVGTAPTTEVAAIAPAETTPPLPLPRSARPKATAVASLPADEEPLVLDEDRVRQQDQAAVEPFPLSDDEVVTGDELEEWDSGSLADYLERKGLLSDAEVQQSSDQYDEDGFFLDEGPNSERPRRLIRRQPEFFLF